MGDTLERFFLDNATMAQSDLLTQPGHNVCVDEEMKTERETATSDDGDNTAHHLRNPPCDNVSVKEEPMTKKRRVACTSRSSLPGTIKEEPFLSPTCLTDVVHLPRTETGIKCESLKEEQEISSILDSNHKQSEENMPYPVALYKVNRESAEYSKRHPFCSWAGLDVAKLLTGVNPWIGVLCPEKLVNGTVVELFKLGINHFRLADLLYVWMTDRLPSCHHNEQSIIMDQMYNVKKYCEETERSKNVDRQRFRSFLNQPFEIPSLLIQSTRSNDAFLATPLGENKGPPTVKELLSDKRKVKRRRSLIVNCGQHVHKVSTLETLKNCQKFSANEKLEPSIFQLDSSTLGQIEEPSSGATRDALQKIQKLLSEASHQEKSNRQLLGVYLESILPEVIVHWSQFNTQARETVAKTHSLFFVLNALVLCPEQVSETLKLYECMVHKMNNITLEDKSESQTISLIRTSCEAFAAGGDVKSGCYASVVMFLLGRGVDDHLVKYQAEDTNTLFHNAALLYYQRRYLVEYLENFLGTPNELLSNVLCLLKNDLLVAGCRALGLIGRFLVGPLYSQLKVKSSILKISLSYARLIGALKTCNMRDILDGSFSKLSGMPHPQRDEVLQTLTSSDSTDTLTELILTHLLQDIARLFQGLLIGQIPCGLRGSDSLAANPGWVSVMQKIQCLSSPSGSVSVPICSVADPHVVINILFNFGRVGRCLHDMESTDLRHMLSQASTLWQESEQVFKFRHRAVCVKEVISTPE